MRLREMPYSWTRLHAVARTGRRSRAPLFMPTIRPSGVMCPVHLGFVDHAKLEGAAGNLRYLHTFVSIVDAGGIARASARLKVSQPAASRQLLALEAELGVPLFDRIGRRLRLTSQGEDL